MKIMSDNSQITLSVFFPAYYDEKNIDKVVVSAIKVLDELKLKDYEITIIEDGSQISLLRNMKK